MRASRRIYRIVGVCGVLGFASKDEGACIIQNYGACRGEALCSPWDAPRSLADEPWVQGLAHACLLVASYYLRLL